MRDKDQSERVDWRDGDLPVSVLFDDPYFSLADGLAETRHVFLAGNGLPGRFRDGFQIAELGFGTGLNLLATADAWNRAGTAGTLQYTSFEAHPMPVADMTRALRNFPALGVLAQPLLVAWSLDARQFRLGPVAVEIIEGDARSMVPVWRGLADAWFLDGFSPAKNPEMWEPPLLAEIARRTAAGGTFATYSAAGAVRRGLQAAGFRVERGAGFGRKRHMSHGGWTGQND